MPTRNVPASPVGENLKQALTESGMTQEALAREIGVSLRTVQGWTSGRILPRWPRLVLLAAALEKDPEWFYTPHDPTDDKAAA